MKATKKRIIAVLACLLIAASAVCSRGIRKLRGEAGSVELKDAPPMVVFTTVVLGGFRGLLADVLWLRASLLQDEGRYFELVQLSDWITKLEPGLPDVWAFHAWNMTYNISVMMPRPEDRWRWVQNGLFLLRDEGLVYNPGDPKLFFELGWIFQNKLGESIDVMHLYYKQQWAAAMEAVTGAEGRIDYDKLTDETRERIRNDLKMEISGMRYLDERYGPFDWRLPEAHAVYWGYMGIKAAEGRKGYISCDRLVYQSLMQMFRRGRLDYDRESGRYRVSFNPAVLEGVIRAFEDSLARHPGDRTIEESYSLFLREAVRRLANAGMTDEAVVLFRKAAAEYNDADTAAGYDSFIGTGVEGRGK